MKRAIRYVAIGVLSILMSTNAAAILITSTSGTYTHDTSTQVVRGDGFEWLRWDVTQGMSIADALSVYKPEDGWDVATVDQMSGLINDFTFLSAPVAYEENASQILRFSTEPTRTAARVEMQVFLDMFGETFSPFADRVAPRLTGAFFGEDNDLDGGYNAVTLGPDEVGSLLDPDGSFQPLIAWVQDDVLRDDDASDGRRGIALVRRLEVASVPEPGSILMLLSGFCFLVLRRVIRAS